MEDRKAFRMLFMTVFAGDSSVFPLEPVTGHIMVEFLDLPHLLNMIMTLQAVAAGEFFAHLAVVEIFMATEAFVLFQVRPLINREAVFRRVSREGLRRMTILAFDFRMFADQFVLAVPGMIELHIFLP
jgi:hypothetical protein